MTTYLILGVISIATAALFFEFNRLNREYKKKINGKVKTVMFFKLAIAFFAQYVWVRTL
jgi:hypothetical protein